MVHGSSFSTWVSHIRNRVWKLFAHLEETERCVESCARCSESSTTGIMAYPKSRVFRAPGRVNLIGEHTDYNDGFVMPAAIGFSTWVTITPLDERKLSV